MRPSPFSNPELCEGPPGNDPQQESVIHQRTAYAFEYREAAFQATTDSELTAAVDKRLDTGTLLGLLLSGRLDSSLVHAIGMDTDAIDLEYTRQAAGFIGADHITVGFMYLFFIFSEGRAVNGQQKSAAVCDNHRLR